MSKAKASEEESALGICYGLGVEILDIAKGVEFYSALGFSLKQGSIDSGWIAMGKKKLLSVN
ncbi:MAG: hypothetical protein ACI9XP_001375 [Lentimonas sp.]|jgi:hypothetical protein